MSSSEKTFAPAESLSVTQIDLARRAGVSASTVYHAEIGRPVRYEALKKMSTALGSSLDELNTSLRFLNPKTADVPYLVHNPRNTVWYLMKDNRRKTPEDNQVLIQDSRERERLGRLGLSPVFIRGLDFLMPTGPGISLAEVHRRYGEISSSSYRDVVYYVVRGEVIVELAGDRVELSEGGALGCSAAIPVHLEPLGKDPALVMVILANRIGKYVAP